MLIPPLALPNGTAHGSVPKWIQGLHPTICQGAYSFLFFLKVKFEVNLLNTGQDDGHWLGFSDTGYELSYLS